jgi:hypothetical protein
MVEEVKGEGDSARKYKVVEISTVTEESIEEALNDWTARGYVLEGMHFAMRESSRRPAMAFLVFTERR